MHILTINTGSSSLKAALYGLRGEEARLAASIERIGLKDSRMRVTDGAGSTLVDRVTDLPDHGAAFQALLSWLEGRGDTRELRAVGHRVVHGGREYSEPQRITDELLAALRRLLPVDPNHLPQAIEDIEASRRAFPKVLQVACFDTAFHRRMPDVAQTYALPPHYADLGVIRYGFHGLSYEYIMAELARLDPAAASGRTVIAHLGNGASMAAVRDGRAVDTTMGFSPTGGLVMGTRTGDLDPGVLLYLLQSERMSPDEVSRLVNARSGLLGISEVSADMHDLLQRQDDDPRAAAAVALFCYTAKKHLGALFAVLGGIDTLVFTAGIGEHAPPVRACICAGLEAIGIELDPDRNEAGAPVISREGSRVTVWVMKTDEDLMIARHTRHLLQTKGEAHVHV